jgi:hypothetical protein
MPHDFAAVVCLSVQKQREGETMSEDDEKHEWEFRLVIRVDEVWHAMPHSVKRLDVVEVLVHERLTEAIVQRRRKRDHLDPTPCEGIEHPVWRDWEASPDALIQGVLMAKGMPFRSLEK